MFVVRRHARPPRAGAREVQVILTVDAQGASLVVEDEGSVTNRVRVRVGPSG